MRYRFEHCGNPEYVEVHVDVPLTELRFGLSDYTPATEEADKTIWANMQGVTGVTEIRISKYSVSARRAGCFSKEEVCRNILERLVMHLTVSGVEVGELAQLPTYREDLAMTRCPACIEEERREMELSLRDDETVDY